MLTKYVCRKHPLNWFRIALVASLVTAAIPTLAEPQRAPASPPPGAAAAEAEFLQAAKSAVSAHLHSSRFHAEFLEACAALVARGDGSWFSGHDSGPEFFRSHCELRLKEHADLIQANWKEMRIALSLSRPAFREDRLLEDVSVKLRRRPKHLFTGVAKLPPLTAAEVASAVARYDAEVIRLRKVYRAKKPHRPANAWYDQSAEDRFVLRALDEFRELQRKNYLYLLSEAPILALTRTASPSAGELGAIFSKIRASADRISREFREDSRFSDEPLGNFLPVVQELIERKPQHAAAFKRWLRDYSDRVALKRNIGLGIRVILGIGSLIAPEGRLIAVILGAGGLVQETIEVVSAVRSHQNGVAALFSKALDEMSVSDLEALSETRREKIVAGVLLQRIPYMDQATTAIEVAKAASGTGDKPRQ